MLALCRVLVLKPSSRREWSGMAKVGGALSKWKGNDEKEGGAS
jgi:hypothetical protein